MAKQAAAAPASGAREAAAMNWLSNPVIPWVLGIGGALALGYFFWPSIFNFYSGAKQAASTALDDARAGFASVVDGVTGTVSTLVGSPPTQEPDLGQMTEGDTTRTAMDALRGVFTEGDRALSDGVDWFQSFFS